ncbi:hypothetical protein M9434_002884 [Picochlorum sp. BPE23]|nr:hypothetical protein M9434_002884 [Picochlorum sp. BPE23]
MITRKGRDIGICFLRTCFLKPVSVAGLVEPHTHVSGPTSVSREQHASPSVFRIHSSYTPAGNALNRSTLEAWRRTLPSVEEMHRVLKLQAKKQPLPTEQSVMDWRDCVKISREAYENEMRGGLGVQSLSFKEWLLQRSLVDSHARRHSYLRISLTEKCNLRCLYCMPEEGVDLTPHGHLLNTEEIVKLVELFALAGVNKVRLTGGEPTIRKDLANIVKQISSIEGIKDVGITSNGLVLSRSLEQLKDAGLSLINLSLDTLKPARFEQMTRRKGHERVLGSINKALDLGYNPVKINVVVMKGVNDDEILDFVELTRNKNVNVRFIEYMPFDGNVWSTEKLVSYKEMFKAVNTYAKETSGDGLVRFADGHGEVAKNFRVPGFKGSVSFITSMTSQFCGDCNRVRLMADGNIKVCLFGNNEVSLLDALREGATDEDLLAVVSAAVDRKKAAHAGMDILHTLKNRPMVKIGG